MYVCVCLWLGQMNGVCSPSQQAAGGMAASAVMASGGCAGNAPSGGTCTPSTASLSDRTGSIGGSLTGRTSRLTDPPRRSRSQGTRKLHKCLSTASYSEDGHSSLQNQANQRQQLLVARQYCSFGSTLTNSANYYFYYYFNYCIYLLLLVRCSLSVLSQSDQVDACPCCVLVNSHGCGSQVPLKSSLELE